MLTNYEGVLKIDGEVGNKKQYDPRAWGKVAEAGMAARIVEACWAARFGRHPLELSTSVGSEGMNLIESEDTNDQGRTLRKGVRPDRLSSGRCFSAAADLP